MKVLGVGDEKYICEITLAEMRTITGTDNEYDYDVEQMIGAGTEVDLDRIATAARWIRNLDVDHLNSVIEGLQLTINRVEKVKDIAEALNLFNRIGEKV